MVVERRKAFGGVVGNKILCCLALFFWTGAAFGQQTQKVNKESASGNFINEVQIILLEASVQINATEADLEDFYHAFFIKPGTTFNPLITDLAIS